MRIKNSPGWIWTVWQRLAPLWRPVTSSSFLLSSLRSVGFHICVSAPPARPWSSPSCFMWNFDTEKPFTINLLQLPRGLRWATSQSPVTGSHPSCQNGSFIASVRDCPSVDQWDGGKALPVPGGEKKRIHLADEWRCCPKGCWLCSWWVRSLIKSFVQPSFLLLNVRLSLQSGCC